MPRRLSFIVLSVLIGLVVCEAGLRLAAPYSGFLTYHLSPVLTRNFVPDPMLGYRMSPHAPGHDARGYRNPRAQNRYDVLAIGDSMTYGLGATAEDAWPRQLAGITTRTVYNGGVGGYGPCEYLLAADELLALKPSKIIVGLYLGNDVGNAYASVYVLRRCPELATRDARVVTALALADKTQSLSDVASQFGDVRPRAEPPTIAERLAIYRLGRSLRSALTSSRGFAADGPAESFDAAAARPYRIAMASPAALRTVFRDPRLDLLAVNLQDPRMEEGLETIFRAIERLRTKAAVNGAELVVAVLRSKAAVLAPLFPQQPSGFQQQFAPLVDQENAIADRVAARLNALGIRWVDTGGPMGEAVAGGERLFHETDDSHPNAAGYGVIARAVATLLGPASARR